MEDAVGRNAGAGGYLTGVILLITQLNETADNAYYILVDATTSCISFRSFTFISAVIRLAYRKDRTTSPARC